MSQRQSLIGTLKSNYGCFLSSKFWRTLETTLLPTTKAIKKSMNHFRPRTPVHHVIPRRPTHPEKGRDDGMMQISCIIIFFMLQVASYGNVKNIKWKWIPMEWDHRRWKIRRNISSHVCAVDCWWECWFWRLEHDICGCKSKWDFTRVSAFCFSGFKLILNHRKIESLCIKFAKSQWNSIFKAKLLSARSGNFFLYFELWRSINLISFPFRKLCK